MKDDHVHSPEETDNSDVLCTKSTSEMSRTQDTHSQQDDSWLDNSDSKPADNSRLHRSEQSSSHAQILKEVLDNCKPQVDRLFKNEGLFEAELTEIINKAISLTEAITTANAVAATLKEIDSRLRLIDFKRLLTKKDYEILDGVFKVLEDYQKELGASS